MASNQRDIEMDFPSMSSISDTPIKAHARLLATIGNELDFALIAVSLCASISSARAFLRPLACGTEASRYFPAEPRVSSIAAIKLSKPGLSETHLSLIADFYDLVDAAKALTLRIEHYDGRTVAAHGKGAKPLIDDDWVTVSGLWRRSAAVGYAAADAVHRLAGKSPAGASAASDSGLELLINRVVAGASPCVTPAGDLVYPSWADRRNHTRRQLNLAATLHVLSDTLRPPSAAIITDISQSGLGLIVPGIDTGRARQPGTRVAVVTNSGRRLAGVVVWASAERLGIRLIEPLFDSDVLLTSSVAPSNVSRR